MIPRWTTDPVPGVVEHHAAIDADLEDALRRLVKEVGVPLSSIMLAAHAKVLAALTGDPEVVAGYVAVGRAAPLPCRLSTEPETWRDLLRHTAATETALAAFADPPVDHLVGELGVDRPFETVLDPGEADGRLDGPAVLTVTLTQGGTCLSVRCRGDVLDAAAAARVAGYHLTALALMSSNPDAVHRRQSLLSADELRLQLVGLEGPRRELPDRRLHELFEDRVRHDPQAVAAVHGDCALSYAELNARANRVARALLARGLRREGIVAVVMERNLEWMVSVLAILKAGGVYLPLEPHFPAERISTVLTRAGCRLVLTEPGSATTLDEALTSLQGTQRIAVTDAVDEDRPDSDLGVVVTPDQLAYIFFTSGSTGEPKGAMCEHAGLLNHVLAKVDDLGIREGDVVAQIAPQCFDISLWQLLAGLVVGAQTLIIEQEVVLDVAELLDRVVDRRVTVLQVVPSYLEAVLSHLERHPRELPALRYVSVTGEAVKRELVQRWFRAQPRIKMLNAYGLTETSDDTNHEVMDRVPEHQRVPVGRPVRNVRVYVLDENLAPVPLGAVGEIAFSGICVGRGYVNDPDRTRLAFTDDPHRPGERLYRSGDFGRWLPDGKLEFLGRRDTQVKVSGFRIEIGEIENALLRVPGVRDGAVVVSRGSDRDDHLVGFYTGGRPIDSGVLRARLGRSLPAYMVPAVLHQWESLPLTANGKVDRKALTTAAGELGSPSVESQAPSTPTERRIASAWATILGVPVHDIGRNDHFFDRGGTSLSAVRLAIALDRDVSLKDVTRHPVLAELAAVVDGRSGQGLELIELTEPSEGQDGDAARVLVCFAGAGGAAADFRPMAEVLGTGNLASYAVEPPTSDVAAPAPVEEIVERVVDELRRRGQDEVLLWGQGSAATCAVATARSLEDRGLKVLQLFVGAPLPGRSDGLPTVQLSAPVTVVVAAADRTFIRTRAREAAQEVLRAAGLLPTP
jgi:amino acid adenylation domain-containing protein